MPDDNSLEYVMLGCDKALKPRGSQLQESGDAVRTATRDVGSLGVTYPFHPCADDDRATLPILMRAVSLQNGIAEARIDDCARRKVHSPCVFASPSGLAGSGFLRIAKQGEAPEIRPARH